MRRLPRRLALWGGAAAIAGGGFAFMASNNVFASSAGDGAGPVTGYNVSNQTYTTYVALSTPSNTTTAVTYIKSVTFTLTSQAKTSNADGPPKIQNMNVYPLNYNTGTQWGHQTGYCSITTPWALHVTGSGYGTFTCTFNPKPPVHTVHRLDVEATQ